VKRAPKAGLAPSIAKLFEFQRFRVQAPKAFLYQPYSPKVKRRLELHTPARYALWVRVETDVKIFRFNECAEPVALPLTKGVTVRLRPGMVTEVEAEPPTIHTFSGAFDDDDLETQADEFDRALRKSKPGVDRAALDAAAEWAALISAAWSQWCEARDALHREWKVGEVFEPRQRLENLDRLLRYTTRRGRPFRGELARKLVAELRTRRTLTVYALAEGFPAEDQEEVITEIADLIISGVVHSDIDVAPFTHATELSAFGPIEKTR